LAFRRTTCSSPAKSRPPRLATLRVLAKERSNGPHFSARRYTCANYWEVPLLIASSSATVTTLREAICRLVSSATGRAKSVFSLGVIPYSEMPCESLRSIRAAKHGYLTLAKVFARVDIAESRRSGDGSCKREERHKVDQYVDSIARVYDALQHTSSRLRTFASRFINM
jgi:hypothetical protein